MLNSLQVSFCFLYTSAMMLSFCTEVTDLAFTFTWGNWIKQMYTFLPYDTGKVISQADLYNDFNTEWIFVEWKFYKSCWGVAAHWLEC